MRRSQRRTLLAGGATALVATAPSFVIAGEVEVEGGVYQGATTGEWVCGPVGRARYAGSAAMLRVSERSTRSEQGAGWNVRLGAAAEAERVTIVSGGEPCEPACESAPPDRVLYGGGARLGYRDASFGLESGLSLHQAWSGPSARTPELSSMPELELSLGKPTGGRGFVGIGTPWITTQRRPAVLYAGGVAKLDSRYELLLGGGVFRAGPATLQALQARVDLQVRMQLANDWELRAGNAFSNAPFDPGGFESMLSVVTRL